MSFIKLQEHTAEFFHRHWPSAEEIPAPVWSDRWDFIGTIPNYDKAGCYALFCRKELIYVGVSKEGLINSRF